MVATKRTATTLAAAVPTAISLSLATITVGLCKTHRHWKKCVLPMSTGEVTDVSPAAVMGTDMNICRWFGTVAECRDNPCQHWEETNMKGQVFKSFTSTFLAFARGEILTDELRDADLFEFNCAREHVIRTDNLLPHEATWVGNVTRVHIGDQAALGDHKEGVNKNQVATFVREKWNTFLDIIICADKAGRIRWKAQG